MLVYRRELDRQRRNRAERLLDMALAFAASQSKEAGQALTRLVEELREGR